MPIGTEVVNLYEDAYDVYIGRPADGEDPRDLRPGEYGFLGNPFPGELQESLDSFQAYFLQRIEDEPLFQAAVASLRGKRLGCFCHCPEDQCHGELIAAWVDRRPVRWHQAEPTLA